MKSKVFCTCAIKSVWFTTAWLLGANAPAKTDVPAGGLHLNPLIAGLAGAGTLQAGGLRGQSLFAGLPMDFVQNLGQERPAARFVACNGHLTVSLEPEAIRMTLIRRNPLSVTLAFEGASKQPKLIGEEKRKTVFNYYLGNEQSKR